MFCYNLLLSLMFFDFLLYFLTTLFSYSLLLLLIFSYVLLKSRMFTLNLVCAVIDSVMVSFFLLWSLVLSYGLLVLYGLLRSLTLSYGSYSFAWSLTTPFYIVCSLIFSYVLLWFLMCSYVFL